MSLQPESRSRRPRSKSRTRDRSRSHSNVQSPSYHPDVDPHSSRVASRHAPATTMSRKPNHIEQISYPPSADRTPSSETSTGYLPYPTVERMPYPAGLRDLDMGDFTDYPPEERVALRAATARLIDPYDEDLAYGSMPGPRPQSRELPHASSYRSHGSIGISSTDTRYARAQVAATEASYLPLPHSNTSRSPLPHENTIYAHQPPSPKPSTPISMAGYASTSVLPSQYTHDTAPSRVLRGPPSPRLHNARVVEVTPGVSRQSSLGLTPQMDRLTVGESQYDMTGVLPPPSPLLEPYHGTYQSISPIMAPMVNMYDGKIDELPSLSQHSSSTSSSKHGSDKHSRSKSNTSTSSKPKGAPVSSNLEKAEKKRVKLYNAEEDAVALNEALSHHRGPDSDPICDILPHLTHDQILELRVEYKRVAKVSGRGINIAKHIKMRLGGHFGKAAYVTALGRWESEGYWANFWYQSHSSRRELLIESIMGRSNAEIREIKASFRDKRYGDDLVKCMEKELKPDKFRVAILIALEGRRQEETEVYPREYVDKDASILRSCILSSEGGETAMLDIVTRRSDAHLREVLKMYEQQYGSNFARDALKRSNNLVGEVLAHVLNGVINKPARDSVLLRHAVMDIRSHDKEDELRYELLISRAVRLHWDRSHLTRVKREYENRQRRELEEDLEKSIKGDFREFMLELCRD